MKINKESITKGLFAFLIFLILIEPAACSQFVISARIYTYLQYIIFVVVCFVGFQGGFRNKIVSLLLCIYYLYLFLITLINHGRVHAIFVQAVHFIGLALFIDMVIKNNPEELFRSALNILTILVVANCIIIFVYPEGLYETVYYKNNYLLGYDNQNINFMLPAMVLVLLKHECYKRCYGHILLIYLSSIMTAVKIWSGMTLVVTGVLSLFAIFYLIGLRRNGKPQILSDLVFNFRTLFVIDIGVNISLVLFRLQYLVRHLIEDLLHKDISLTNRTMIWDKTLEFIKLNPVLGYGREDYAERALKFGFKENSPVGLHAHNRLLETFYSGGVILFSLFVGIIIYVASKLYRFKETAFAKILSFGLFVYLMGMTTEYYEYCIWLWGILVIAENSEALYAMNQKMTGKNNQTDIE